MGENVCGFIKMLRRKFKFFSLKFAGDLIIVKFPPLMFPENELSDMAYEIGKKYGLCFLTGGIGECGSLKYVKYIIVAPKEEAERWKIDNL